MHLKLILSALLTLFVIGCGKARGISPAPLNVSVPAVAAKPGPESQTHLTFFKKNCFKCHDEDVQKGDLRLDNVKWEFSGESLELWKKIYIAVESEQMPPKKKAAAEPKQEFLTKLRFELAQKEEQLVKEGGRSTWRRLTRQEYENSLRDLFGMPHLDVARFLPRDGDVHGFSKISEALDFSSVHWKSYMAAAEAVLWETCMPEQKPETVTVKPQFDNSVRNEGYTPGKIKGDEYWIFTNGFAGLQVKPSALKMKITSPGRYKIHFQAKTVQGKKPHILRIYKDGKSVEQSDKNDVVYFDVNPDKWQTLEAEAWIEEGSRICFTVPENKHKRSGHTIWTQPGVAVKNLSVSGPYFDEWPLTRQTNLWGSLKTRRIKKGRDFIWIPRIPKNPGDTGKALIRTFLPKLFRRPVAADESAVYTSIFNKRLAAGEPFHIALMAAYKGAMCSPAFLFKQVNKGSLSQHDLTGRLSYFLWNSSPDDKLLKLASEGLLKGEKLESEVARMLSDPKAERFINDFNEQWLNLDDLFVTTPDTKLYPDMMPVLFDCMKMETNAFLKHMIDNDLSVLNIVDSDFAMLNSRLAKHYNIKGVEGMNLRPVKLPENSRRGGIITHGSVLKVTANGSVTSPITRGVWFLENILGTPPPPPPNAVPAFEPEATAGEKTLKEGLAEHRTNTACNGCHRRIDPPGFAFENYDPVGAYRERYRIYFRRSFKNGPKIDSGDEFKETKFNSMDEFKKLILKEKNLIVRNFIDKLIIYATGKPLGYSDDKEVERIISAVKSKDFGTKSLIKSIVNSSLFLRK